jgi:hypothetical protein
MPGLGLSFSGVRGWLRFADELDARRRCDRSGEREARRDTGEAAEEPAVEGNSEEMFR